MENTTNESKIVGIDIGELSAPSETSYDCPLAFNADGDVLAGVKVVDANSERYRAAKRKSDVEAVKRGAMRRKTIDAKTDEGANDLLTIGARNEKAIAVACVVDWYGFTKDGKQLPFDSAILESMLTARPSWVEIIMQKVRESASFFETSKSS